MADDPRSPCRSLPLAGGSYRWCGCGGSTRRPFCDPARCPGPEACRDFEVEGFQVVRLCRCLQTRTPPYCDGGHLGAGNPASGDDGAAGA